MLERWLGHLDKRLGETKFLAGDNFSIADLTAFISIETTKRIEFELPASYTNVSRWLKDVESRPSANA